MINKGIANAAAEQCFFSDLTAGSTPAERLRIILTFSGGRRAPYVRDIEFRGDTMTTPAKPVRLRHAIASILTVVVAAPAHADDAPRQNLDDAWWTGPIIANSPNALPPGHVYVESYAYDAHTPGADGFGSSTFLLYGVTKRFTLGVIPVAGYDRLAGGQSSSRIGAGDLAIHAQYQLSHFDAKSGKPAIAVAVEENLPTGRYDNLARAGDGFGSGAYATTVAAYAQDVFWLRNGRILRMRLNLSQSFPGTARVNGVSVYGTAAGFSGRARPGAAMAFDNAWEYSLTRSWVAAVDFYYRHGRSTGIDGTDTYGPVHSRSGPSDTFAVAPAVEYSWTSNLGVLFGARFIVPGRNTRPSVTPVIALSAFL